jgi:predicted DNA-binding transcriptional regulator YafY
MDGKFNNMLKILNILDSGKSCTPSSLIEELMVSERTVFRYINSLKEAGFPITFDEEKKTYTFEEGFALKRANLEKKLGRSGKWTQFRSR